jgi:hypothetical protein
MERTVQPEQLDHLPPEDPRAIGSRRDLRRINTCMGNARLSAAAIRSRTDDAPPERLVDLGAGDGHFLRQLTRHLPELPRGLEVVLVDRRPAADERVIAALKAMGFRPRLEASDALDWLRAAPAQSGTWIVANLFLHHFLPAELTKLLALASEKSGLLCACEPRRGWLPLTFTHLLRLIGANSVTRHDATVSVRAGFVDGDLSSLWPGGRGWQLSEHRAGLFSHLFLAQPLPAATRA